MKRFYANLLVPSFLAVLMATPVSAQVPSHDHPHGKASAPAQKKPASRAVKATKHDHARADKMDMKEMCDMHEKTMSGKSASEQQATMDEKMAGMSDDEKRKHMKMMDEHCK